MSATPPGSEPPLRFGRFELRPREYRLLADGEPVALGGRAMDLLLLLAARAGELVTRNELIEHAWPGRVVEDNNLSVQVKALRKALGDEWLVTVPGRGYRLDLPVPAGAAAAAPPAAATAAPVKLPGPSLPLIGRETEVQALHALIDRHRLVSVLGAGGIGKTRLARAVLAARTGLHPDGVCWVELGPLSTAEAVPAAVAAALGLPAAAADTGRQLRRALGGLQLLLALDNAEHLVDAVAELAQGLLEACSSLHLLVTSQAPLRLSAEHVLRLGPMALPQAGLSAAEAQRFDAIALFCERASAADHRFVLRDGDVPAVVGLCQGLDGSPLAIELAASRAATLGVPALHAALAGTLALQPRHGDRLVPARQRSLRAALAWSVGLLPPAAAQLFCTLGVVAGSASLDLVLRLGEAAPGTWDVLDALDELVQRSLVELVRDETEPQPRYRLLELPRALSLEQLAARGDEGAVRLRHAQGVLADYEQARAALHAGQLGPRSLVRWVELNMANARAAMAHARQAGQRDLELALASAVMPATVASTERLALADRCAELLAKGPSDGPVEPRLELRVQRAVSIALANLWPVRSRAAARRSVDLARQVDPLQPDRYELYAALCGLAQKLTDEEGGQESEALLQEALTLEDARWPAALRWVATRTHGMLAMARGQADRAVPLYRRLREEALAADETGHLQLLQVANAELAAGEVAAAVAHGQLLLQQLAASRDDNLRNHASVNLMLGHLALGQLEAARAIALQVFGGPRPARPQAWFVDALAWLAALEGRLEAAARLAAAATTQYESAAGLRQINEQRAHENTLALLLAGGVAVPPSGDPVPSDAELIALALAPP